MVSLEFPLLTMICSGLSGGAGMGCREGAIFGGQGKVARLCLVIDHRPFVSESYFANNTSAAESSKTSMTLSALTLHAPGLNTILS